MSPWKQSFNVAYRALRAALLGVGFALLFVVGFAAAMAGSFFMRPLAPVVLVLGIVGVSAALIWRAAAAHRQARAAGLARRAQPEGAPAVTYHGLALPDDASLADDHAWVRTWGVGMAAVGADDLAVRLLGPVDQIVVPPVGTRVERGDALFALRRGARTIEVRSPVSGRVCEHNPDALKRPTLINNSPYEHGWIVRMDAPELARQRGKLHHPPSAWSWFRAEVDRALLTLSPGGPMPAMPDGGVVSGDLHLLIDDETWSRIRAEFFGCAGAQERR